MPDSADRPGDPQISRAGLRASRAPDALCAETRVRHRAAPLPQREETSHQREGQTRRRSLLESDNTGHEIGLVSVAVASGVGVRLVRGVVRG